MFYYKTFILLLLFSFTTTITSNTHPWYVTFWLSIITLLLFIFILLFFCAKMNIAVFSVVFKFFFPTDNLSYKSEVYTKKVLSCSTRSESSENRFYFYVFLIYLKLRHNSCNFFSTYDIPKNLFWRILF